MYKLHINNYNVNKFTQFNIMYKLYKCKSKFISKFIHSLTKLPSRIATNYNLYYGYSLNAAVSSIISTSTMVSLVIFRHIFYGVFVNKGMGICGSMIFYPIKMFLASLEI